jgi:predicted RNA methylase
MLNDGARNEAFRKAINFWIENEGKERVADIGAGTGLLSLYASKCDKVKEVTAIESDATMCSIASKVFSDNGQTGKIKLINKSSTELQIGKDIPSKFNLVVSEILDCGIFGEGILETFIHAKEHLLEKDGGVIVPHKVIVNVAGYNSKFLCSNNILLNDTFNEYIFLENVRLIADRSEPYDGEYVDKIKDFQIVTNTVAALDVNFNSIKSMNQIFDGIIMKNFQLQSNVSNDYLDGFIVWFDLYLNEKDPKNVISTKPFSESCWNQAIFKLRERVMLQKYEIIKLTISCRNGVLRIEHEIDVHLDTIYYEIDPFIIKFLNDEDYLENLEYAANEYKDEIKNCLDLSPFPYIGFLMLKESRVGQLWCSRKHEELIIILAAKNCIDEKHFTFIDESDMTEVSDTKFELIILNLFTELGDFDNEVCCNYALYQKLLTNDKSLLIPYKISLFGELINSEWLANSCRVTNERMAELKIDKHINEYSTALFLEIYPALEYEKLTDEFRIATILLNDELQEKTVQPFMRNINLSCNGIMLYFKIQFTMRTNREFSSFRSSKFSCFRKFAHIFPNDIVINNAHAKIHFMQNYGIFKLDCE